MGRETDGGLRLSIFLEPPEWGAGPQCIPEELPRMQPLLGAMRWSSSPEELVRGIGMGQGKASRVVHPTQHCTK